DRVSLPPAMPARQASMTARQFGMYPISSVYAMDTSWILHGYALLKALKLHEYFMKTSCERHKNALQGAVPSAPPDLDLTSHVSRLTFHASRSTPHVCTFEPNSKFQISNLSNLRISE